MTLKNRYLISRYAQNPHETHETHALERKIPHLGGLLHEIMNFMCMNHRGGGGVYFFLKLSNILMKLMKLMH